MLMRIEIKEDLTAGTYEINVPLYSRGVNSQGLGALAIDFDNGRKQIEISGVSLKGIDVMMFELRHLGNEISNKG